MPEPEVPEAEERVTGEPGEPAVGSTPEQQGFRPRQGAATASNPDPEVVSDERADTATHAEPVTGSVSARTLWRVFWEPGWTQFLVGLIVLIVAMSVVLQIRAHADASPYRHASRQDLIQLLDSLNQESHRLEKNRNELEITLAELESGVNKGNVARKEAEHRAEVLGVLAGTSPAHGPGVELTLYDPREQITPGLLLDCVHELRDAGAEVIEINGSVRVVANSWFSGSAGAVVADGTTLTVPIQIKAIGEPHALAEGVRFRGGVISQVEAPNVGGSATVTQVENLVVTSVNTPPKLRYATPRR